MGGPKTIILGQWVDQRRSFYVNDDRFGSMGRSKYNFW